MSSMLFILLSFVLLHCAVGGDITLGLKIGGTKYRDEKTRGSEE